LTALSPAERSSKFITISPDLPDGQPFAFVDWAAAITALDAGDLPCSGGQQRMLRLTASLGDGIPATDD
jgi:hypothetical protein